MASLHKQWEFISAILQDAASALPPDIVHQHREVRSGPLHGTLDEFSEFLAHNEFELAWDALAAVAKESKAKAPAWLLLARAAHLMGFPARVKQSLRELEKALVHESPSYRLVYKRRYRNPQGRTVWRQPSSSSHKRGLVPV
jgi:hypothetical protein